MSDENQMHPVERIRSIFAEMSEESGLRNYSSIRGFAEFVGCSESAIRKVEKGGELTPRLAKLIEWRTGVSAKWLVGSSGPSDPIIGVNGLPWNGENLDLFRLLPALKPMLVACPSIVPLAIGRLVESMLMQDFLEGRVEGLLAVTQMLQRRGIFCWSDTIDGPRFEGFGKTGYWRSFERQPLLDEALSLMLEVRGTLSESQLHRLEYLKSVEPPAPEGARTKNLLEDYRQHRRRALRRNPAKRRQFSHMESE
jgi:hypothetical protein